VAWSSETVWDADRPRSTRYAGAGEPALLSRRLELSLYEQKAALITSRRRH
jgi:hypothetical protein